MAYSVASRSQTSRWACRETPSNTLRGPMRLQGPGLRHYSPGLGRWIGREPLGETGDLNLVRFSLNSPIMTVDYLGMLPILDPPADEAPPVFPLPAPGLGYPELSLCPPDTPPSIWPRPEGCSCTDEQKDAADRARLECELEAQEAYSDCLAEVRAKMSTYAKVGYLGALTTTICLTPGAGLVTLIGESIVGVWLHDHLVDQCEHQLAADKRACDRISCHGM